MRRLKAESRAVASRLTPIAVKAIGRTEGDGFFVTRDPARFAAFIEKNQNRLGDFLIQDFIQGHEFSVNAIAAGNTVQIYEPVSKSHNCAQGWRHPCQRLRICPDLDVPRPLIERLAEVTRLYVAPLGARGLMELEFVVDAAGDIWFLEINPRLSATARMTCFVSELNIFSELAQFLLGTPSRLGLVPTLGFSQESPISREQLTRLPVEKLPFPYYAFSSRSTVYGRTPGELERRILHLAELLNERV